MERGGQKDAKEKKEIMRRRRTHVDKMGPAY